MKTYQSLLILEKNCPDLFCLIRKTKITVNKDVETAYCKVEREQNKNIFFSIVIGEKFHNELDAFSLAALIEHELLHIVLTHLTSESFKTIAKKDHRTLNIAMDSIINDLGDLLVQRKKLNKLLLDGVFLEKLTKELGVRLHIATHSTLDVYELLKEKLTDNELDAISCFDDHLLEDLEQNESSKEDLDSIFGESDIKNSIEKMVEKKAGNIAAFDQIYKGILEKRKSAAFKKAVNNFLTSNKSIESRSSWKKLSRRFVGQKGKIRDKTQTILLALDVSGSMMSEETLKKIKSIVCEATKNEYNVDLIFGDVQKTGEKKNIDSKFDFGSINGGGGTELGFIFEEKLINYDGIVVVTDGCFDYSCIPKKMKSKLFFLLTEKCDYLTNNFKTSEV